MYIQLTKATIYNHNFKYTIANGTPLTHHNKANSLKRLVTVDSIYISHNFKTYVTLKEEPYIKYNIDSFTPAVKGVSVI